MADLDTLEYQLGALDEKLDKITDALVGIEDNIDQIWLDARRKRREHGSFGPPPISKFFEGKGYRRPRPEPEV